MAQDEARLVEAARRGDRAAFGALVLEAAPMMERLAVRMLGHRQDAEDVTQEAVLHAWRALPRFRGEARFSTWIYRILVARALDSVRRRRGAVEASADLADEALGPPDHAHAQEVEAAVRGAIEELPPVQRATLLLRMDQGLGYDEIAYVLGSTRNAVRMNLIAARKTLARRLRGVVDLGPRAGERDA